MPDAQIARTPPEQRKHAVTALSSANRGPKIETRMRHAARREQLLDIAEALFSERGYAAVTMEDISRAAGVTRPMTYRHFGSREGVYLACVERARGEYLDGFAAAINPEAEPRAQLAQGAEAFFRLLEANPGRWLLLFSSSAVLPVEYQEQLAAQRFQTIGFIATLVRRAARNSVPEDRVQAFAHAMSGVGERLGHWWVANPSMTREQMVDHFIMVFWDGMSSLVK